MTYDRMACGKNFMHDACIAAATLRARNATDGVPYSPSPTSDLRPLTSDPPTPMFLSRLARPPLGLPLGQLRHGGEGAAFQAGELLVDVLAEAEVRFEGNADADFVGSIGSGCFGRHDAPLWSRPRYDHYRAGRTKVAKNRLAMGGREQNRDRSGVTFDSGRRSSPLAALASVGELRNRLADAPFELGDLLVHLPVEPQKRLQRNDHLAGRGFISQHHEPLLRRLTGHSCSPLYVPGLLPQSGPAVIRSQSLYLWDAAGCELVRNRFRPRPRYSQKSANLGCPFGVRLAAR